MNKRVFLQVIFMALLATTTALGGNNVFGVLRKRRRSASKIQEKRVQVASRKGFAGPNGERLSIEETQALQQKLAYDSMSSGGRVLHHIRNMIFADQRLSPKSS